MCGIALCISKNDRFCCEEIVRASLSKITHRGHAKHQYEIWSDNKLALGANRLPFTSSTERQPVSSDCGRYMVLLNGEIYNWHHNKGKANNYSDTKSLANALTKYGLTCLSNIDGMYAIAIYDSVENTITLARDMVGIKPLYYTISDNFIIASSEIKGLCHIDSVDTIEHVEPSSFLTVNLDSFSTEKSKIEKVEIDSNIFQNRERYCCEVFKELKNSVIKQSQDQKKYGVFLSGGIDSSAIYSLLLEAGRDVVPFVLGNCRSEDKKYATDLCREHGQDPVHIKCPSEKELFKIIHEVIYSVESYEPNVVRQSVLSYLLGLACVEYGINVAMCGEGADELFGGYPEIVNSNNFNSTRAQFLKDLHRTQLQRVDRMSMKFTIEVRVPYLSKPLIGLAVDERALKYHLESNENSNFCNSKMILRKSLEELLPSEYVNREKVVFSEGAGLKSNDPKSGMFADMFVSKNEMIENFRQVKRDYPEWRISSLEEAFYFQLYKSMGYHKYAYSKKRVYANSISTLL